MIWVRVGLLFLIMAVSAGAAWKAQDMRYGQKIAVMEAKYAQAAQEAEAKARAKEREMRRNVDKVAKQVQVKQDQLLARAAESERVADSLRDTISALNTTPSDPGTAACVDEARTARIALGACAARYIDMAKEAEGLIDQVTGLQEYINGVLVNKVPP